MNHTLWITSFPLLEGSPKILSLFFLSGFIFFLLYLPFYLVFSATERKWTADVQARVGPSLVGVSGLLQPISDQIKALVKRRLNFVFSFPEFFVLLLLLFQTGLVPITSDIRIIETKMAPFLFLWFVFLVNFYVWWCGSRSHRIEEEVVANRWIVQTLAGLLPAVVSCISAVIGSVEFGWAEILSRQGFYPWEWIAFKSPFLFFSFLIFVFSGTLTSAGGPFSSPFRAFKDLKRSVFLPLVRFLTVANWMLVASALYLGGPSLPHSIKVFLEEGGHWLLLLFLEWGVHAAKAWFLLLVVIVCQRSFPELSSRQACRFGFHFLFPLSLLFLIGALFWRAFGTTV